jgi:hypothetical protein
MIEEIRQKVRQNQFEFSQHAVNQSILRHISVQELREAIEQSEIIEDYPDDKYGASCLLLGFTIINRPLHIHFSYPFRPLLKIITLYEPDPNLWINLKLRRIADVD